MEIGATVMGAQEAAASSAAGAETESFRNSSRSSVSLRSIILRSPTAANSAALFLQPAGMEAQTKEKSVMRGRQTPPFPLHSADQIARTPAVVIASSIQGRNAMMGTLSRVTVAETHARSSLHSCPALPKRDSSSPLFPCHLKHLRRRVFPPPSLASPSFPSDLPPSSIHLPPRHSQKQGPRRSEQWPQAQRLGTHS